MVNRRASRVVASQAVKPNNTKIPIQTKRFMPAKTTQKKEFRRIPLLGYSLKYLSKNSCAPSMPPSRALVISSLA